jgi:membrane associated rhomboid family serine protease
MIPIGDSPRTRTFPVITLTLIGVNGLVFFFELMLPTRLLDRFIAAWGVTPAFIVPALFAPWDPESWHPLATLFTSQFIHGGWAHIIGNMLFLWIFGDNVEDSLGHVSYLLFYLFCGVVAGVTQSLVLAGSRVPLIGASGAIAGVLGAYLVLFPHARVQVAIPMFFYLVPMVVPAPVMLGMWFLTQLINGTAAITFASGVTSGVGWWAHIGGFVAGYLLAHILPVRRWREIPWWME